MEDSGQIFIPIAFLTGIILAIFLWLATSTINFPDSALAADPKNSTENMSNNVNNHRTKAGVGGDCQINRDFPAQILQWCDLITHYSLQHGLEPDLLAALIYQESGGDPLAYSHSGAVGLMQVMPHDGLAASFTCPNGPCFQNRPSINELQDPEFNISYGTKMLAGLIKKNGSIREALKSYGPAGVGYYYSDIVLSLYKRFRS
ncbi:MAG: hypothetical protein H6Q37_1977 [Chloroflexi bacterium]|jgi:hypothetical protein|nr:hypothetical protein [Chloroflexota bacterium]